MKRLPLATFALLAALLAGTSQSLPHETDPSAGQAPDRPALGHLATREPITNHVTTREDLVRGTRAEAPMVALPHEKLAVPHGIRMLVFAPHPDDETLAAGGLIRRVLRNGGQVRVVFVTNGDGFTDGVRQEVKWRPMLSTDFIAYGKRRQDEARNALSRLGLRPVDGIFLGFPDGGIDDLWSGHWSRNNPYTSPFTRFDRPRYSPILSRWARYTGSDLRRLFIRALRDFQPDWVVVPDLRDTHPDHSATGAFLLDALHEIRRKDSPSFSGLEILTYVVHYPDCPVSTAWMREIGFSGAFGCPTVQGVLATTKWLPLPLSIRDLAAKEAALLAHQTQIQTMHGFLEKFLLPYEPFGKLEASELLKVSCEHAAPSRREDG